MKQQEGNIIKRGKTGCKLRNGMIKGRSGVRVKGGMASN